MPAGTPGLEVSLPLEKLGWRASDTRELSFRDCTVPWDALLGERGHGFRQFLEILDGGRISVAALAVGLSQGAYEQALAYAGDVSSSDGRSAASRRCSSSSPTWRPRSPRPGASSGRRPG